MSLKHYTLTFIDDGELGVQVFLNEQDAFDYAEQLKNVDSITFISIKDGEEREIERFEKEC